MKLNIRWIMRRHRRPPAAAVEARLRRYGQSLAAPPEAKQAGLTRVMEELERAERDRGR